MSWKNDYDLRNALSELLGAGQGSPNELVPLIHPGSLTGHLTYRLFTTLMASGDNSYTAVESTFERDDVYDLYLQYTAHSSSVTVSDFYFVATGSCGTYSSDQYPAVLPLFCADSMNTLFGFAAVNYILHLITKEGWVINGVSYPSIHVAIRG